MIKRTKQQHGKQRRRSSSPQVEDVSHKPAGPDIDPEASGISSGIPVVGIGGSAGAMEPFKTFFSFMPADSGAAFVVIQHLAPAHESLLPELLAQHTRMKVVQVRDAMPIEPNCVYVIPPNQYLAVRGGVLHLVEPIKQAGIRMPIDFFFRSLAEDRRERAICIVFSGAGSDGTLGVREIRGEGGLTIAQDPQTAQFTDMPHSAIATGLVDFVLSPDRMAESLLTYLQHPYVRGGEPETVLEGKGKPGGLQDILAIVLTQTGSDFRYYKKSTILRRIERRMGLHHISDVGLYYDLLRADSDEIAQLYKDLLNTLRELQKVQSISNHVFHVNGERLYYVKVQRAFKKALNRAKIEDFHFHDLRHTFASKCVHAGIDLYAVQKLLGHKDGRMTQRYAHLSSDYLRDAVAKLNKTTTILLQPEVKESVKTL